MSKPEKMSGPRVHQTTTLKQCAVCQNFAHCTAAGYCNCGAYSVRQEAANLTLPNDQWFVATVPLHTHYCVECGRPIVGSDYLWRAKLNGMLTEYVHPACLKETCIADPPCIGLDPDTDPCPFCGAWLSDECGAANVG